MVSKISNDNRSALLVGVAILTLVSPVASHAADSDQPPAASSTPDIVVTAQRRSESLSKTPVAVTVVNADTLAKAQIVSEQDLRVATPGLQVRAGVTSNQLNYAIRGQTLDAFSDGRPGVLPYINDVQVSGSGDGGSSAFYDLQSVQLLKGPQGTLFGRSATGGAVLFTTQKPKNEFGGYASLTGGNYNAFKGEGAINLPLVKDKLLLRVSGFYQRRDGYQYNLYTKSDLGGFDRYGGRGSLTARLGSSITNELVVDYNRIDGSSQVPVLYNFGLPYNPANPGAHATATVVPAYSVLSYYAVGGGGYSLAGTPAAGYEGAGIVPLTPPTPGAPLVSCDSTAFSGGYNPLCGSVVQNLQAQHARGPYVVNSNGPNYYIVNSTLVTNTTTIDVGPETKIKNIFGFARATTHMAYDLDGTAYTNEEGLADSQNQSVTNELQLLGKTFGGNLSYVIGGYFSSEKYHTLRPQYIYVSIFGPVSQTADLTKRSKTYAAYAQGTYDLSSVTGIGGLGFTLGARYTSETLSSAVDAQSQYAATCNDPGEACFQQKTVNNVGWTVGLQEQLNNNILLYGVSRRSYKNGGFNSFLAPFIGFGNNTANPGNQYGTETLTDGELGTKFQGYLGIMPARLNIAGYIDWITNSQHTAYAFAHNSLAALTINVPKAQVKGVELDGQISPLRWLSIGGSLNYTDAKFTDGNIGGLLFATYPDTPKWSGAVYADVNVPVRGDVNAFLHGDYFAQTFTWATTNANVNQGARYPGYGIASFRVGLEDQKAGWSLTANVKNAFKKVYYAGGSTLGLLLNFNTVVPGDPRTFSVEVRYKF